ncbi:hypothetical protein Hdeb2414_s0020g00552301 [Helianthus debilis subsp. tardiflorus]
MLLFLLQVEFSTEEFILIFSSKPQFLKFFSNCIRSLTLSFSFSRISTCWTLNC